MKLMSSKPGRYLIRNNRGLADAYDGAIKQLKAEKKTNELSKQFYGRDLYEVLDKVNR